MPRPKDKLDRLTTADGSFSSQEYVLECVVCKEKKPLSEFYTDKYSRNGYRSKCKKCHIAQNSSPEDLEKKKTYNRIRKNKNPKQYMYYSAKYRAKRLGIPFNITLDDIYVPKTCPIFGTVLKYGDKYTTNDSPSLDRVNPELGYVKGNVCVISYNANRLKRDATIEVMERIVSYMKSYRNANPVKPVINVSVHFPNDNNKSYVKPVPINGGHEHSKQQHFLTTEVS